MTTSSIDQIRKFSIGFIRFGTILSLCFGMIASPAARAQGVASRTSPQVDYATSRHGGWLDEIDMSVVPSGSALDQLQAGALDVYANPLSSAQLPAIKSAGLNYASTSGTFYDILYNPAACSNPDLLNPFADHSIREATNRLYDRDYINQAIYAGGGLSKFFAIQTNGPDYTDLIDVAHGLEADYAFDENQAITDIASAMNGLGATLVDGKWQYHGSPVTLIFLIRSDGDGTRLPLGNYVADQLEKAGFTVDRQYKRSSEASPIWIGTDPVECQWNLYTAGWSNIGIQRDEKAVFQEMYLPDSVDGYPYTSANVPDPAFQLVGDSLANANFTTVAQRHDLMAQALQLSLQDSLQVWIVDTRNYAPYSLDVQVTADQATGLEMSPITFQTARFAGVEGGTLKWGETDLFTAPWNPVAGSNWSWDMSATDATSGAAFMPDPYTGLSWPLRAESADVIVQTGLPVTSTLPWVTLSTSDTINVPTDAWADWDASTQEFITVADKFPSGTTSKIKVVLRFPNDLFDTVKWHDGSNLSVADFVMQMIMTFDQGKPDSAIYDSDAAAKLEAFLTTFKGVKIVSTSPLVIETYSDNFYSDAELDASLIGSWWPTYSNNSEAPWESIALGNIAVANNELAWGSGRADRNGVDWLSFIGGPSLSILSNDLDSAIAAKTIPYAATMGAYLTADDAAARYSALKTWYTDHGQFWVGTGPYYLDTLNLDNKTLVLKNFALYPDLADRWSGLGELKVAEASVTGPGTVNAQDSPTFDVSVTYAGDPYPNADIKFVRYLLYDSHGSVVETGPATAVGEGQFQVTLSAATTASLADGNSKIEAVVVVSPGDIATFAHFDFTMVNPSIHVGLLDEIDYSVSDADSAITQINNGAIDLYSYGLPSNKLPEIKSSDLCSTKSYGTFYDFMFNAAIFSDHTKLNPFSDHKIREAMNWAIDRNYINQEIYAGGSLPKFFPLATQLVDYTGVIDTARGLEAYYAYNLDKARAVVNAEMPTLGATKGTNGKWLYHGAPVTLTFLIRNDGDGTRLPQGEYFAGQLEALGFTVNKVENKSSVLSPIWIGSDPGAGQWNIYTAGWSSSSLSRDEKGIFQEMYLPDSVDGYPYTSANVPDPVFQTVGDNLANANFTTLQQRHDLMTQALPLALKDSLQVWTVDLQTYAPFNCKLQVSADVGAGVESTKMSPYTMRIKDQLGGLVKVGSASTMFTDPWNPINGSNWVSSGNIQNAVQGGAFLPDPYTGLSWPLRAESADVTVQSDLPVTSSLPWVTLSTADTIDVPTDAWADWDAAAQKFITVADKFPSGTTSKIKVTLHFPPDLFDTVKWHDGSNLSVADFVMQMIMTFDQGKPDSAIYDEDTVGNLNAFLTTFKGVKIVSTSPLVIETYSDNFYSDAELDASLIGSWWPTYQYGEAPWESIALGNIAVANNELAWGSGRADRNGVDWLSFIGGPSLGILSNDLDSAIAAKTIPYAPTMSAYLTADDAVARYTALKTWYTARGHFWDGTGPYYLASVHLAAGIAVVRNFGLYPDSADRWSSFGEPRIAEASVTGPDSVTLGDTPIFDISVTFKGDPYPNSDIKSVSYLLYDPKGNVVDTGSAAAVGEGHFQVTLSALATASLGKGTSRVEAVVVVNPVVVPTFSHFDFLVPNAPSNDLVSGATSLIVPAHITQNTIGNTISSTDPSMAACLTFSNPSFPDAIASVWYKYVPTQDGILSLDTIGSDYDTALAVYLGTPSVSTRKACNDDRSMSPNWDMTSQLALDVKSGSTYYIEIVDAGFAGSKVASAAASSGSQSSGMQSEGEVAIQSIGGQLHLNASINPCWSLTVTSNNTTYGTVATAPAPNCVGTKYSDGTEVTLTATSKPNYRFSQWSDTTTVNPYIFTISSNKTLQAQFVYLAAPVLTSPAAGYLTNDNTPGFTWNSVPYGSTYEIQIDHLSTFTAPVDQSASGLGLSYTASLLTDGLKYWRVRTITANSEPGAWSAARSFTVDTTAPLPPVLSAPADGAVVRGTPTFSWLASATANAYQFAYDLADCSSPSFTSAVQSGLTYLPPLMPKDTYYWCVKARDPAGNWSGWSASRSITIRPLIPVAPVLTSPAAGFVTNDPTPYFAWNSVPYGNTYEIQIASSSSFTSLEQSAAGLGVTNYTADPALSMTGLKYWRVRAVNVDSELGAWSAGRAITIKVLPPSVPTLLAPASNALLTNYTPTLDWSQSTLPSGITFGYYQVEVATDAGFSSIVRTSPGITSLAGHLWVVDPLLASNTKYYWHVKACNSNDECSAWSSVRYFRTALPVPITLVVGVSNQDLRPLFTWQMPAYPTPPAATGYTLQVSKNITFTQVVHTGPAAGMSYIPTGDLPRNLPLFWRVRANGLNGPGAWSDYSTYTTHNPPGIPTLLAPASNALLINLTPTLDWSQPTIPIGTAFKNYAVEVSLDAGFSSISFSTDTITDLASHFWVTPYLDSNTKYYWHVKACNSNDECSAWSPVRYFRTALPTPNPLSEDGSDQNLRPKFTWEMPTLYPSPAATSYTVQVSKNTAFTLIVHTGPSTSLSYIPTADLPRNLTLYWRVRANGLNGPSAWSAYRQYITGNPPGTPTLVAPASNALLTTLTPLLDWNQSTLPSGTTFESYQVKVATDAGFTTLAVPVPTTLTSLTGHSWEVIPDLPLNALYYWHVKACNTSNECSAWSSVRIFRIALPAPDFLNEPDGTSQDLRPLFFWTMPVYPGPAATSYTLQVSKNNIFTSIVHTGTPTDMSYIPTADLPRNLILYWRVRANGLNGPSAWSDVGTYTTGNPPGIPALVAPANNALLTTLTPTLDWSQPTIPGGTTFGNYFVVFSTASDFSIMPVNAMVSSLVDHYYEINVDLAPGSNYYWRVEACNSNDECSAWSSVRTFRTP